jgi:D-arabinose 1-dehydrogenase-like Zn-dependent alcohol dehydrogenase
VIGAAGGVGIHMIQMASLFGAQVAGLESNENKFEAIRQMGAVPVLSRSFDDVELDAIWGGAAPTVVIDLVGSRASLKWALDSLPLGGRLVVLTTFRDVDVLVSPRDLVSREITVYGSRYASKSELREGAELVAAGRIRPVVSRTVPPSEVEDVHRALRQGTLIGRGALDWNL